MLPSWPELQPDPDAEALALGRCYALARRRAAELRLAAAGQNADASPPVHIAHRLPHPSTEQETTAPIK